MERSAVASAVEHAGSHMTAGNKDDGRAFPARWPIARQSCSMKVLRVRKTLGVTIAGQTPKFASRSVHFWTLRLERTPSIYHSWF